MVEAQRFQIFGFKITTLSHPFPSSCVRSGKHQQASHHRQAVPSETFRATRSIPALRAPSRRCAPPIHMAMGGHGSWRALPACFHTHSSRLPASLPLFPNLSHQVRKRPLTHFSRLMCHIRKTTTCPTQPSRPHSRIPDVSHQERNRPPMYFSLLMCHIRKAEG